MEVGEAIQHSLLTFKAALVNINKLKRFQTFHQVLEEVQGSQAPLKLPMKMTIISMIGALKEEPQGICLQKEFKN